MMDDLLIEAGDVRDLQIRIVPGGGAEITYTTPDGAAHTVDLFPTVANATPETQYLLDVIGPLLGIRMEHECSVQGTAIDTDDLTAAPTNPRAPMRPALEFRR